MKILRNNKGISLFELLIVLAIMAVVTGLATVSLSLVNSANVNKAAENLSKAVDVARVTSMAKGPDEGALHIRTNGTAVYYYIGTNSANQSLISKNPVVASIPGGDVDVTFNSAGMITAGSCNIKFTNNKKQAIVYLAPISGKGEITYLYLP